MAVVTVTGPVCVARISEPDEEGEHTWQAVCGAGSEYERTDIFEDAIAHASTHVDACER